jgi:hypothetical protein
MSPGGAAKRGKAFAGKVAGSKIGKSIGAYASANPKKAVAMGMTGAAGMGRNNEKKRSGSK